MGSRDLKMSAGGGLEQFLLLAKGTKGAAAAQLIHDALASPNVYVFGELLDIENIQALEGTEFDSSYQVLKMFTYGNYTDYKNSMMELPTLTPPQLLKLKHLSLITMAAANRTLEYSTLLDELDISNVRELEDLIIEAIYRDVIHGKLDQSNHQLLVEAFIGRDIKLDQLDSMIDKLDRWCSNYSSVVQTMEQEMTRANSMKLEKIKQKDALEQEVKSLKEAVNVATKELDQSSDLQENQSKFAKKGLRGSSARSKINHELS